MLCDLSVFDKSVFRPLTHWDLPVSPYTSVLVHMYRVCGAGHADPCLLCLGGERFHQP